MLREPFLTATLDRLAEKIGVIYEQRADGHYAIIPGVTTAVGPAVSKHYLDDIVRERLRLRVHANVATLELALAIQNEIVNAAQPTKETYRALGVIRAEEPAIADGYEAYYTFGLRSRPDVVANRGMSDEQVKVLKHAQSLASFRAWNAMRDRDETGGDNAAALLAAARQSVMLPLASVNAAISALSQHYPQLAQALADDLALCNPPDNRDEIIAAVRHANRDD